MGFLTYLNMRSLRRALSDRDRELADRKQAEASLRTSEERFRVAFQTSPDASNLNRLDDGVYVAVNEGFTRLSGWAEREVLGRSSLDLDIWEDPADRARLVAQLQAHGCADNLEAVFRQKGGGLTHGLMSARVVRLGTRC